VTGRTRLLRILTTLPASRGASADESRCPISSHPRPLPARDLPVRTHRLSTSTPRPGAWRTYGSSEHPWSTLEEVFAENKIESRAPATHPTLRAERMVPRTRARRVKAGIRCVAHGYHAGSRVAEYYNADTSRSRPRGTRSEAGQHRAASVSKWILRGLTVSPSFAAIVPRPRRSSVREPQLDRAELRLPDRGSRSIRPGTPRPGRATTEHEVVQRDSLRRRHGRERDTSKNTNSASTVTASVAWWSTNTWRTSRATGCASR